jgi:hypothetical protein
MASPKRKLALAILAEAKPDKFGKAKDEKADEGDDADDAEMSDEETSKGGLAAACKDFFAAGKAGDFDAAADALRDALEIAGK